MHKRFVRTVLYSSQACFLYQYPSDCEAPKSFEDEVGNVLVNIDNILSAAHCLRSDVVKVTVFISDIANWPLFDSLYAKFFSGHRPARSVVPSNRLHDGYSVDVVYAPIFRYFDVFDQIADFGVLSEMSKIKTWRAALAGRPSVMEAAVPDYHDRLLTFLRERPSFLSSMVAPDG